jgi:amino-acid N-acetyltransferase
MNVAPESVIEDVLPLLERCALPTADILAGSPVTFFGIRSEAMLVAVIGLELYPPVGLLRSLAVSPSFRGRGFAHALVEFAESFSASHGVDTLFLLTTTAEPLSLALGYAPTSRNAAPAVIQATSQFSNLCPASSSFLSKHVSSLRAKQGGLEAMRTDRNRITSQETAG